MGSILLPLVFLLLIVACGIFTIITAMDLFEHLRRSHPEKWQDLSFNRPFGMDQDEFFFYPVRPLRFLAFLLSDDDLEDNHVLDYKKRIKLLVAFYRSCTILRWPKLLM